MMRKKGFHRRKGASGQPLEAKESARSPASAAAKSLARREAALARREAAVLVDEQAIRRRGEAADRREEAARANTALGSRTVEQLREANERLVVATVSAQTMTEAAEQ